MNNLQEIIRSNKRLLQAILVQNCVDYIDAYLLKGEGRFIKKRERILMDGEAAKHFLFFNTKQSEKGPYGFKYICRILDYDPDILRKKLKERLKSNSIPRGYRNTRKSGIGGEDHSGIYDFFWGANRIERYVSNMMRKANGKLRRHTKLKITKHSNRPSKEEDWKLAVDIGMRYLNQPILEICQRCQRDCKQTDAPGLFNFRCEDFLEKGAS